MADDISLHVNYQEVKKANEAILAMGTTAQKSASVFEKAFRKVEVSQNKALTDAKKVLAFSKAMEAQKAREASVAIKAARTQADANRKLRFEFRDGYAAAVKLRAEQMRLSQAHRKGIIDADQLAAAQGRLGNSAMVGGRKMSSTGMAIQQTGYQVGDFLVQVQGGTNVMVAFGQQATQLVGVLPMVASSLGMTMRTAIGLSAGLGIAIPLVTAIGAYFMRAGEAASNTGKKLRTTADVMKDFSDATKEAETSLRMLQSAFNSALKIEAVDKITDTKKKIEDLSKSISDIRASALTGFGASAGIIPAEELKKLIDDALKSRTEGLQSELDILETTLQTLQGKERLLQIEKDYQELMGETADALVEAKESYRESVAALEEQNELLKIQKEYGEDSVIEAAYRIAKERERLDVLVKAGLLTKDELEAKIALVAEGENLARGLRASEDSAVGLTNALKEAVSAMSSLAGFSAGLDKALAVSVAKVQALKSGADEAIAGTIAGMRVDLKSKMDSAVSAGIDRGIVESMFGGDRSKISAIESSETNRKALAEANRSSARSGGGGGGSKEDPAQKALEAYRQLVATYDEVEAKTLKVEAARKTLTEAERLGVITSQQSDEALKEYTKTLGDAKSPMLDLANTASQSLSSAFMAIVDGSKSASDAFGDMARAIIKQAFEMAVINPIINSIFGGVKGFSLLPSFFAAGGAFSGGSQIQAYADGGVVGSPTTFPMAGGKTGLMGEAGPEAIMPLKRGANGKLGVQMEGGGSNTTVINQSFNFQANGDESVKRIIAEAAPRIASMTQQSMMDQRRRGGAMKGAFG